MVLNVVGSSPTSHPLAGKLFESGCLYPVDYTVTIVQLVRASDCGSECRGFESH